MDSSMNCAEIIKPWALKGCTANEIIQKTKLPRSTVKYHLKKYAETGSWGRREYPMRVKRLEPFEKPILKHLESHPHASATQLHSFLASKYNVHVSIRTIQRFLKTLNHSQNPEEATKNKPGAAHQTFSAFHHASSQSSSPSLTTDMDNQTNSSISQKHHLDYEKTPNPTDAAPGRHIHPSPPPRDSEAETPELRSSELHTTQALQDNPTQNPHKLEYKLHDSAHNMHMNYYAARNNQAWLDKSNMAYLHLPQFACPPLVSALPVNPMLYQPWIDKFNWQNLSLYGSYMGPVWKPRMQLVQEPNGIPNIPNQLGPA